MPSFEEIVEEMAGENWEFLAVLPGQDAVMAENIDPPQLIFRRLTA